MLNEGGNTIELQDLAYVKILETLEVIFSDLCDEVSLEVQQSCISRNVIWNAS